MVVALLRGDRHQRHESESCVKSANTSCAGSSRAEIVLFRREVLERGGELIGIGFVIASPPCLILLPSIEPGRRGGAAAAVPTAALLLHS